MIMLGITVQILELKMSSMALTTPTKGPMALVLRAVMCKKEKNIIHCLLENVELNDVCSNIRYISFLNT